MRILIVIPVFNEEKSILDCLQSLDNQTYKDFKVVISDDNSTDNTVHKISDFILDKPHYELVKHSIDISEHIPGAKIVRNFYNGLKAENLKNFEVICKFDSDLIFPENYLVKIVQAYKEDTNLGMVSGHIYIQKNNEWQYESISNKKHIRGPIKSYRKECFKAIKGLRETIGWDNIDELLALKNGFTFRTLPDLHVKQIRETGNLYQVNKGEKLGQFFYHLGVDFPLTVISAFKASWQQKSIKLFSKTLVTYLGCRKHKVARKITDEERKFIVNYRWNALKAKIFS